MVNWPVQRPVNEVNLMKPTSATTSLVVGGYQHEQSTGFISKETDKVNISRQWAPIMFAYRNVHFCCPPPLFYSFSSLPLARLCKTAPVLCYSVRLLAFLSFSLHLFTTLLTASLQVVFAVTWRQFFTRGRGVSQRLKLLIKVPEL